ncbi:hypothetical protein GCM10027563_28220 [Parasphingorhabdus pacifica]
MDTGSLNGIYLNRRPLRQQSELADGDEIWVGKARFAFHLSGGPRRAAGRVSLAPGELPAQSAVTPAGAGGGGGVMRSAC